MRGLCPLLLLLFLVSAGPSLAGVVLIANAGCSESDLDHNEVKRIYLGKKTHWDDDTPIIPVILKSGETHEEFLDEYPHLTRDDVYACLEFAAQNIGNDCLSLERSSIATR